MNDNIRKELATIDIFQNLAIEDLDFVASYCKEVNIKKGEVLFYEGEEADCLYIMVSGEVEVWVDFKKKERDLLAVQKGGYIIGEMAVVDKLPRSATIIACDRVKCYKVMTAEFHLIMLKKPEIALALMKTMSNNVRRSNESFVGTLRKRNEELEKTNQQLIKTQKKLLQDEKLSTMGQFSSMILHDLKNPLSVIKSYIELAQYRYKDQIPEKVSTIHDNILRETLRLNSLSNELLDYTRGEIRLNLAFHDITMLFKEVLKSMNPLLSARQITVKTEWNHPEEILLDGERISRLITNLLDNCRKAVGRNGNISIETSTDESVLVIKVTDDGIGIMEDDLKNVFEPFYTKNSSGGTGLGMLIVKNIVEAHEGYVTIESEVNKGTEVVVTLPLRGDI